ncbi:MAG: hypothetical protein GDA50_03330 [Alphaproteobacteria bacterium GM202ARS2]|nr:hypothetical protein [Alphaproteobacteria bacterium GM202ARS2]
MAIIPSSYARVPINSQDVRVHASNSDVLAFKVRKKTSIRTFLGRKIAFITKRFSKQTGSPPPLPPRGQQLTSRHLLSPRESRQHVAEQFAQSFKDAVLQQHQLLKSSLKDTPSELHQHKMKALQTFSQHTQHIAKSFEKTIEANIEKASPVTGRLSRKNLSGREISNVYQQFESHLTGLNTLTNQLQSDMMALKQNNRQHVAEQFAQNFKEAVLQQHQLLKKSLKQAPHGLREQKNQALQTFADHIQHITQSFQKTIEETIEKPATTGRPATQELSKRDIDSVYKQFASHLKELNTLTTQLRADLLKQSPQLLDIDDSAADYEKGPFDEQFETEDSDDDYMPLIDYLRSDNEDGFQGLNPATREQDSAPSLRAARQKTRVVSDK